MRLWHKWWTIDGWNEDHVRNDDDVDYAYNDGHGDDCDDNPVDNDDDDNNDDIGTDDENDDLNRYLYMPNTAYSEDACFKLDEV